MPRPQGEKTHVDAQRLERVGGPLGDQNADREGQDVVETPRQFEEDDGQRHG